MHATPILQYLRKHGEKFDTEIATVMGIPLPEVQASLSELSSRGETSQCSVTRFPDGKPVQGMLYRAIGYIPPKAPGRKAGG